MTTTTSKRSRLQAAHRARAGRRHLHPLRRLDHGTARLDRHRHRAAARAATAALAQLLAGKRRSSSPRPSPGSFTTPRPLATGSTSCAAPTPPRPSNCAHGARRRPAPSRLAQSLGLAALLSEGAEMDAVAVWRQYAARAQRCWARIGAWITARRRAFSVGAAAVAAGSLLCVLRGLRIGAHLSARVVAALLVQHPLRHGTAAGSCARARALRRQFLHRRRRANSSPSWPAGLSPAALLALIALNASGLIRERPLVYVEGTKNMRARTALRSTKFRRACAHCSLAARAAHPDGHFGRSRDRRPHRHSAAPDHQRSRPADLSRRTRRAGRACRHRAGLRWRRDRSRRESAPRGPSRRRPISRARAARRPRFTLRTPPAPRPSEIRRRRSDSIGQGSLSMGAIDLAVSQFMQPFEFDRLQQVVVANGAVDRLLLACTLTAKPAIDRLLTFRDPEED